MIKIGRLFQCVDVLTILVIALLPFSGASSPVSPLFYIFWLTLALVAMSVMLIFTLAGSLSALVAMLITLLITLISCLNFLVKNTGDIAETITVLLAIPIIYSIAVVYRQEYLRLRLSKVVLSFGVIHGLFSLIQIYNGVDPIWHNPLPGGRPSGIFSWGAPVVGSFLGVSMMFYYLLPLKDRLSNVWLVAFWFSFGILIISGNRSMLLVHLLIFALNFSLGSYRKFLIGIFSLTLIAVFTPAIVSFLVSLLDGYLTPNQAYRLASMAGGIIEEQQGKRIATWVQTGCAILDSPFFGYPIGSFPNVINSYLHCAINSEGVMPHPHSFLLELLFYFGLFGGAVIVFVLWASISFLGNSNVNNRFGIFVLVGFASPLNVTHGIVSLWWLTLLCVLFGVAIARNNYVEKTARNT